MATSPAIAIMTIPMGLALSTKFSAICAIFQALEASTAIFEAAACARVAILTALNPDTTATKPPFSCAILINASPVLAIISI